MISVPPAVSASGKRERYFFPTKAAAQLYSEEVNIRVLNFGRTGNGIVSPSEGEQARNAIEALRPFNVPLNHVAQDWISRKRAAEATVSFIEAARQYQAWLENRKIKGRLVSDAYKATVRQTIARFSTWTEIPLSEINELDLATACVGMTPHVKNTCLAVLSAFFQWCMQLPRKWITANPTKTIPRESVAQGEVQTFTAKETESIFKASLSTDLLAYHVLGFFAGIRPEELERTRWEYINLDERAIILPAEATKSRVRRVIEINETLEVWLHWLTRLEIPQGFIVSRINLRKRLRELRKRAGVAWIQDGMRHTYASNWLATHKDEHRLRGNLGHKSADELWDHYHKATTEREAAAFWAILPPSNVGSKGNRGRKRKGSIR